MNEDFVRELSKRVDKHDQEIEKHDEKINALAVNHSRTDTKLDAIETALNNLLQKVEKLMERPAKRWDAVIYSIIAAVVSALITSEAAFMVIKKVAG